MSDNTILAFDIFTFKHHYTNGSRNISLANYHNAGKEIVDNLDKLFENEGLHESTVTDPRGTEWIWIDYDKCRQTTHCQIINFTPQERELPVYTYHAGPKRAITTICYKHDNWESISKALGIRNTVTRELIFFYRMSETDGM